MIISASRRTDIPCCFPEWFTNRLSEGFCYVRNPYNKNLCKVSLANETTDAIIFWTKNAGPMLPYLDRIDSCKIPYGFQYTITPYETDLEKNFDKTDAIRSFEKLSERLGDEKIFWRYDPVIITEKYSLAFHAAAFENFCEKFSGLTKKCTISFIDLYGMKNFREATCDEKNFIAENFLKPAKKYDIDLFTCCESVSEISHGSCIDKTALEKICGYSLAAKKDSHQRPGCNCIESIDIGTYGTCMNECAYCYAKSGSVKNYDPLAKTLCDTVNSEEKIFTKEMKSLRSSQTKLF